MPRICCAVRSCVADCATDLDTTVSSAHALLAVLCRDLASACSEASLCSCSCPGRRSEHQASNSTGGCDRWREACVRSATAATEATAMPSRCEARHSRPLHSLAFRHPFSSLQSTWDSERTPIALHVCCIGCAHDAHMLESAPSVARRFFVPSAIGSAHTPARPGQVPMKASPWTGEYDTSASYHALSHV